MHHSFQSIVQISRMTTFGSPDPDTFYKNNEVPADISPHGDEVFHHNATVLKRRIVRRQDAAVARLSAAPAIPVARLSTPITPHDINGGLHIN